MKSGAIEGDKAEAWKQKLKDEKKVKEWREKAEKGDSTAIYNIGVCYDQGRHGVKRDAAQARKWYERGANARHVNLMARYGQCLLCGVGGPSVTALGLVWLSQAAALGSDLGAMLLGNFLLGQGGLPRDKEQAKFWLRKVVNRECIHTNLTEKSLEMAARWLRAAEAE